jgi:hydrogenase/urease accessory protein HupE
VAGDRLVMRAACALGAALVAGPAQAHLVDTGFGAYYDGLAHVALTPADLLVVLGLALLAGQRGASVARTVLFVLPLAWLAGGIVGAAWPSMALPAVATTLSFALAGALVAQEARMRRAAVAALAAALGLVHGLVNGATMAPGGASTLALTGAATAVFVLTTVVSAEVTRLTAGWTRTAVRVLGSWIAAAGLLTIGWLAR